MVGGNGCKTPEVIGDFLGTVSQAQGKLIRKGGEIVGNGVKSVSKAEGML